MVPLSPLGLRLVKKVNADLLIAVTYSEVPDLPSKLDCTVEFINTKPKTPAVPDSADTGASGEKSPDGWFRGLWGSEKTPLAPTELVEMPVLLGYVQMAGFVRLNHNITGPSISDGGADVLWKNSDYIDLYVNEDSAEKASAIFQTPFFRDRAGRNPKKGKIGGISGLQTHLFDQTAVYLLHDLFFGFNTSEMPSVHTPAPSEFQQLVISELITENIVPFYVTSQHLLFSSIRLPVEQKQQYTVRIDRPSEAFPPSYNMKLTGCIGEAGVVSIGYSFVVGVLEEINGQVTQRSIYFPIEFRPGKKQWGREWLQQDYLQESTVRQVWCDDVDENGHVDSSIREKKIEAEKAWSVTKSAKTESENHGGKAESESDKLLAEESEAQGYRGNSNEASSEPDNGSNNHDIVTWDPTDKSDLAQNGHQDSSVNKNEHHDSATNENENQDSGPKENGHQDSRRQKFINDLDTLISSSARVVGAIERRKSSVSIQTSAGYVEQIPARLKILYQIRVNNHGLCNLTLLKPFFHVGDDISLLLEPAVLVGSTKVVGAASHIEAHELFHLDGNRTYANIYKVTPTHKCNMYAEALACDSEGGATMLINVPLYLSQQFQASSFMDLKYFLVCRFILNDFEGSEILEVADQTLEHYFECARAYEAESESTEFKFLVPLTILARGGRIQI